MRTARAHANAGTKQKRWSRQVTESSNAPDLANGVFFEARSGRDRTLAQAFGGPGRPPQKQSLSFSHAGRHVNKNDRHRLEKAKDELRRMYHGPPRGMVHRAHEA
jgi:hypothetical protein